MFKFGLRVLAVLGGFFGVVGWVVGWAAAHRKKDAYSVRLVRLVRGNWVAYKVFCLYSGGV